MWHRGTIVMEILTTVFIIVLLSKGVVSLDGKELLPSKVEHYSSRLITRFFVCLFVCLFFSV